MISALRARLGTRLGAWRENARVGRGVWTVAGVLTGSTTGIITAVVLSRRPPRSRRRHSRGVSVVSLSATRP